MFQSTHAAMAWVRDRLPLSLLSKCLHETDIFTPPVHSACTHSAGWAMTVSSHSDVGKCIPFLFFRNKKRNHIFPKPGPCHNSQHRIRGCCGLQYLLTLSNPPFLPLFQPQTCGCHKLFKATLSNTFTKYSDEKESFK